MSWELLMQLGWEQEHTHTHRLSLSVQSVQWLINLSRCCLHMVNQNDHITADVRKTVNCYRREILKRETFPLSHPVVQPVENSSWTHGQSSKYVALSSSCYTVFMLKPASCVNCCTCSMLTRCLWIADQHSEDEEEARDSRPSVEFSDLDDDLEEEY